MAVSRKQFVGTHLEGAAQWLLEIEALTMGGWTLTPLPKVHIEDNIARHRERKPAPGRAPSVTPQYRVDRVVRIAEPRRAPIARSNIRHHHFEQKTILASRTEGRGVAHGRAAYSEAYGATDAMISADARSTREAAYTEGRHSVDAERVVHIIATNGGSYDERMAFWQLANDSATFAGAHTVTVSTHGVEASWDRLARNPTMPDPLREALAKARAATDGQATIETNDAGVVRRWVWKQKNFPAELRDNLSWAAPHNGRVAYSIVGQFPHDMSLDGMRSCLDSLMGEFSRRSIPAQAVIHEPTAKNSAKNWHFHLLYYAGPAEQLADGRWSFQREKVRNKWRTLESQPIKRMPKSKEVSAVDWIDTLKSSWRDIVNNQADKEGIATRFTNDSNKKRGLQKAQVRRSAGRQALHKQGFLTAHDMTEYAESWQLWRERTAARFRATIAPLAARQTQLQLQIRKVQSEAERPALEGDIEHCQDILQTADVLVDQATRAAMLHAAMQSGPDDILAYYGSQKEALREKKPTPARKARLGFVTDVCAAADQHLLEIAATVKRLAEIKSRALATLKKTCRSLDDSLSKLEAQYKMAAGEMASTALPGAASDIENRGPQSARTDANSDADLPAGIVPRPVARPMGELPISGLGADDKGRSALAKGVRQSTSASQRDLERLYQALAAERILLMGEVGRRIVPDKLLDRFALPKAIVQDREVQSRLTDIALAHLEELTPLTNYVRSNPRRVVRHKDGWDLGIDAPIEVRRIFANWSHDLNVQAALARVGQANAMQRSIRDHRASVVPGSPPKLSERQRRSGGDRGLSRDSFVDDAATAEAQKVAQTEMGKTSGRARVAAHRLNGLDFGR